MIWNEGLGKIPETHLRTCAEEFVEGKLTTNNWTDNAGVDRYSAEIHLTPTTAR